MSVFFEFGSYKIPSRTLERFSCVCNSDFIQDSIKLPPVQIHSIFVDDHNLVDDVISPCLQNCTHSSSLNLFNGLSKAVNGMSYRIYHEEDGSLLKHASNPKDFLSSLLFYYHDQELITQCKKLMLEHKYDLTLLEAHDTHMVQKEDEKEEDKDDEINNTRTPFDSLDTTYHSFKHAVQYYSPGTFSSIYWSTNFSSVGNHVITHNITSQHKNIICDKVPHLASDIDPKLQAIKRVIDNILRCKRNPKILIVAEYYDALHAAFNYLSQNAVHTDWFDGGNTNVLSNVLHRYIHGDTIVLLYDVTFNSHGTNLQCTTDIVILHRLSCSLVEDQVIGRAQRIGRNSPLDVWKIFYKNEAFKS